MENNPKKSKALIITFIVVLGLLLGIYYLFTSDTIFGVNNSIGKKFSPLLGTPQEKDLNQLENQPTQNQETQTPSTTDTPESNNLGGTQAGGTMTFEGSSMGVKPGKATFPLPGAGNNIVQPSSFTPQCSDKTDNDADGLIDTQDPGCHTDKNASNTKSYDKNIFLEFNSIPQCSDGVDNDKDKTIDDQDPGCHTDGNPKNILSFTPLYDLEFGSKSPTGQGTVGECNEEEIPLQFTEEEQKQLDDLTRQFYRIAPTLKSENDVNIEINTAQSYQDLIDTANALTIECYSQTSTGKYLQPGNPVTSTINEDVIYNSWEDNITSSNPNADRNSAGQNSNGPRNGNAPAQDPFSPKYLKEMNVDLTYYNALGRTERLPNPFFDGIKGLDSGSYFEKWWISPIDPKKEKRIYPWRAFEDTYGVW